MRRFSSAGLGVAIAAVACSAVLPASLSAQGCEDTETVAGCWARHNGGQDSAQAVVVEAKQMASDSAFMRLFGKLTGLGDDAAGLQSAITDFLPVFSAIPSITSIEESDLGVTIETNLPLYSRPGAVTQPLNLGGTLKLRAELRAPQPFSPLVETVPEAQREPIQALLAKGLDRLDDVLLSAVWNAEGTGIGRSYGKHVATFDDILSSAVQAVESELVDGRPSLTAVLAPFINPVQTQDAWAAIIDTTKSDVCQTNFDEFEELDPYRFECFNEPFRTALGQAIANHALSYREYLDAIDQKLEEVGFLRLSDLLNNQPQLNVTSHLQLRDDLVGPRQYGFAVRYERGFANLNSLRSFCNGSLNDVACLQDYLGRTDVIAALDRSDRMWATVELNVIEGYDFAGMVGASPLAFNQGQSFSLEGSLGLGRQVKVGADGGEVARVDVSIEGALNEDDSGRNDRFVASVIYAQKLSDVLTLPLGISYANKAEFIGEVDDVFGVHLGVSWRLRRATPELPQAN